MIIKKFMVNLSERLDDENSLSDITWAYAKSDPAFLNKFMEIFEFNVDEPIDDIYREVSEDGNRPDFNIEQGGELRFIIENKIYNKDDHFPEYQEQFKDQKRGFIANYKVNPERAKKYGFSCTTWEDFIKLLARECDKREALTQDDSLTMLQAYIAYVREVCGIMKNKKINFDSLSSLYHFNHLIEKIIRSSEQEYDCTLDRLGKSFDESSSGRNFKLGRQNSKKKVAAWFGVSYGDEDAPPIIAIIFYREKWCASVFDNNSLQQRSGNYFEKPKNDEYDYPNLTFELRDDKKRAFLKGSPNEQEEILRDYFIEVVNEFRKYL